MPWMSIKGALRRIRVARKMEIRDVAKRSGLREQTIRLHESKKAPRTMQAGTVKLYSTVYACEPEAFAKWTATARHVEDQEVEADPAALPAIDTLGENAKREIEIGGNQVVRTASGEFELAGPKLIKRFMSAYALHEDQKFALAGRVENHDYIPDPASEVLGVARGKGARFLLARKVAKGLSVYATVFTRDPKHTAHLLDRAEDQEMVTVIARVFVRPAENRWKGFFIFQKKGEKLTPRPFAFVVDELVAPLAVTA